MTLSRTFISWLKLAAGMGTVMLFIFGVGPLALKVPGFSSMAAVIEKENVRATAIYYTDISQFSEAETWLRHAMEFVQARSRQKPGDREPLDTTMQSKNFQEDNE